MMVILFHLFSFNVNGRLGVDVFFVISGYFLFRQFWAADTSFDCKAFLMKKVERLFPIAATLIIVSCLANMLLSEEAWPLQTLKTAFATLTACSNFYVYTHLGKLSNNPFVHTWYLSVMVQLYILAALLFCLCRNKTDRFKRRLLLSLACISFLLYSIPTVLAEFSYIESADWLFHSTSGSLWVVCAGAFAHFMPRCLNVKKTAAAMALILMLFLMALPVKAGPCCMLLMQLLIVVCSCVLLVYGNEITVNPILNNRVLQVLGTYSLSLYLFHWPIIVICEHLAMSSSFSENRLIVKSLICGLCVVVPYMAYHLVEKRHFSLKILCLFALFGFGLPLWLFWSNYVNL